MKRVLIGLAMVSIFLFSHVKAEEIELAPQAKSAILIEASTGKILYEKNSHEKLAPASMTKMMSMLLFMEAIDEGVLHWNDMITASENASKMGGSQILLETGEKMSVTDLFKGVAIASGNDAVVALAEAVAGNEDVFVKMMNDKSKELGLKDSNFKNPHGLDDANHYSSAYDMAFIAKELVKHEKIFDFTSLYEDYLRKGTDREFWLVNTNRLVKFNPMVDGLKTGFTTEAGYCLTATAKKNGMRLIAVVMGEETSDIRSKEVVGLLDYGYANYKINSLVSKKDVITKAKIDLAKERYIEIHPSRDATVLTKRNEKLGDIQYKVKLDTISVPLKKGSKVGVLEIKENNVVIDNVDMIIDQDIHKVGILELYWRNITDIISGKMNFN